MTEASGIYRPELSIDGNFTIVPNAWIRDDELGASAKLLLIYLVSHQVGYEIRDPQIIRESGLGRHALRSARQELVNKGWLVLGRARNADNTLGAYRYELAEARGYFSPVEPSPVEDSPVENRPRNKNTKPKKTKLKKNQDIELAFNDFWAVYPKKADKPLARRSFEKALDRVPLETILAGAQAYRDDPNREPGFTKNPSTWLNADAWENGPEVARRKLTNNERNMALLAEMQKTEQNERKMIDSQPHDFGGFLRGIDD